MQNSLSVSIVLAALIGTASAAPSGLISPRPGSPVSHRWQQACSIDGICSFGENNIPNMYGFRGSFNLYRDATKRTRHQFSLNMTPTWGSNHFHVAIQDMAFSFKAQAVHLPVTLGYDFNIGLTKNISLNLGAKTGYAWNKTKIKTSWKEKNVDMGGFTYSVGTGLKMQCSEAVYTQVGYEFGRAFMDKHNRKGNVNQHSILAGVGVCF